MGHFFMHQYNQNAFPPRTYHSGRAVNNNFGTNQFNFGEYIPSPGNESINYGNDDDVVSYHALQVPFVKTYMKCVL